LSIKTLPASLVSRLREGYLGRNVRGGLKIMLSGRVTRYSLFFLLFVILLGIVGPSLAPYEAGERISGPDGLKIAEPPSLEHPLGTTDRAADVLSRLLIGARPTVIAGLLGGTLIIGIGTFVGLTAGYMGGRVDDILMRITDFIYGVPLLPFAIVLVGLLGVGFYQSVLVIGLILWRGAARVIRAQTLQLKEREFIMTAKASGASTVRIVTTHILPNVAPMAVLFFAIGVGYTIIIQAGLAFLGVASPFVPSWGVMIRNAHSSGRMISAWWWAVGPGLMLGLTVASTFLFGRGYEKVSEGVGGDQEALTT
jgi:peptide/nickel transport system permease protein